MNEAEKDAAINEASMRAAIRAITRAQITNRFELLGGGPDLAILTFGNAVAADVNTPAGPEAVIEADMYAAVQMNREFAVLVCKKLADYFKITSDEMVKAAP